MISPVLDAGATSELHRYFPEAEFYAYPSGFKQDRMEPWVYLETPMDKINLHIIGGNIIPTQEPAINTVESRKNPLGLVVALDENHNAEGKFFYDAGDSVGKLYLILFYMF